jgi:hypothetical protein
MSIQINLVDAPGVRPSSAIVEVYDPALCCSSGVCGPGVDPELLRIARDVRRLEAQGVSVVRYNLAQQPAAFVGNQHIAGLLQAFGDAALPAVVVHGEILVHGRYPSRDELDAALQRSDQPTAEQSGRCDPGSGCC